MIPAIKLNPRFLFVSQLNGGSHVCTAALGGSLPKCRNSCFSISSAKFWGRSGIEYALLYILCVCVASFPVSTLQLFCTLEKVSEEWRLGTWLHSVCAKSTSHHETI